jgi:hypothetical protein
MGHALGPEDRSFSQIRERRKLAKKKGRFPGEVQDGTTVSLSEGVASPGSSMDPSSQSIRTMVTCHICQGIVCSNQTNIIISSSPPSIVLVSHACGMGGMCVMMWDDVG